MRPLMPPVQTPDNLFHDGNPLTGELGTIVDAEHLNNEQAAIRDTQSELIAILTAAAMEPESTAGQLLAALNKLYAPLNDTLGALSSLVGGANKLPYFTSANAAALTALSSIGRDIVGKATVAEVLTYLQLGGAAKRDVGTGNNQLPDMSAFGMSRNGQTAWDILPNGMIRQAGTVTLTPVGNFNMQVLGGVTYYTHYYRVNFPRQFPNAQIATLATLASYSHSTQSTMAGKSLATHRDTDSGTDVSRARFTVAYTTPNLGEIPTLHFESIGY
ncbi:TPA: gp53-like domain-containing protein [Enterobacter roggenkampii]